MDIKHVLVRVLNIDSASNKAYNCGLVHSLGGMRGGAVVGCEAQCYTGAHSSHFSKRAVRG